MALRAGIDVELPNPACYREGLKAAIRDGRVCIELVDAAVSRHLQKKFELGLFENPYVDEGASSRSLKPPPSAVWPVKLPGRAWSCCRIMGSAALARTGTLAVIGPNADTGHPTCWGLTLMPPRWIICFPSLRLILPLSGIDPASLAGESVQVPTILECNPGGFPVCQCAVRPAAVTTWTRIAPVLKKPSGLQVWPRRSCWCWATVQV